MTHRVERELVFRNVLKTKTFAIIYAAEAQSMLGDQLARVALVLLVYSHSHSPAASAGIYALTFVPGIFGGFFLSGLADRFDKRSVMIVTDAFRAAVLAVMSIPGSSVPVLATLLCIVVFVGPVFRGAQLALISEIMSRREYRVAMSLRLVTNQVGQVGGFALGGILVAWLGSRQSLAIDALTYVVSATVIGIGLRRRYTPVRGDTAARASRRFSAATVQLIATDRRLRLLVGLSWLSGLLGAPEALAAPYAGASGGGPVAAGVLMAAIPAGSALGGVLFARMSAPTRAVAPAAICAGLPLVACFAHLPIGLAWTLWAVTGLMTGYQIEVAALFVEEVPETFRGSASGLYSSTLAGVQGLGFGLFGLAGDWIGVRSAIGVAGVLGVAMAILPSLWFSRTLRVSV